MQIRFVFARRLAWLPTLPILSRYCLTVALALAVVACGTNAPPKPDTPSVEQRLSDLESRMERLEARPVVQPPYRSKAEIQANIQALEDERAKLLTRYLPKHPAIKDIDRRLGILNSQLKMLE
jgi:hypothetical protein